MKKLIRGIVAFRKTVRPGYKEAFAQLALGQRPDALFIACCDSRVVPDLFASTDPGDLFVVRNIGNLIPPCQGHAHSASEGSAEAAAIEFALLYLPVTEIIVCGHSECGAMGALASAATLTDAPGIKTWLQHGEESLRQLEKGSQIGAGLERHNQLSQINVLQQLEHLKTYPAIKERLAKGALHLHAWWFDIKDAEVQIFDSKHSQFRPIDETDA